MEKGTGTRSGLLWEVERLLGEVDELPQILIMENVIELVGQKNVGHFAEWISFLESIGYKSKWKVLNTTGFKIPQNRERVFMVSWLGDYYYDFPHHRPLEHRLKDLLQTQVEEKYYLSDKKIKMFLDLNEKNKVKGNGFKFETTDGGGVRKYSHHQRRGT